MKQPDEHTFDRSIDPIIQDDRMRGSDPFMYTRIMQAIKNKNDADMPLLPASFSRFAIGGMIIFFAFNFMILFSNPDCTHKTEAAKEMNITAEKQYADQLDYTPITGILLNH